METGPSHHVRKNEILTQKYPQLLPSVRGEMVQIYWSRRKNDGHGLYGSVAGHAAVKRSSEARAITAYDSGL